MKIFNTKSLFIILSISILSAQYQYGSSRKGKSPGCEIHGCIIDSTSQQPIEYASISIIDANNNIINGIIAKKH